MPIPKPKKGEKKTEFVSRCISVLSDKDEFDNNSQRAAVCNSIWEKSKSVFDQYSNESLENDGWN